MAPTRTRFPMTDHANTYPELIIEDAVGVCGVRDDTRTLAEAAAADDAIGRALDLGAGTGYVHLPVEPTDGQVQSLLIDRSGWTRVEK